jgi:outer membrane lipoprotein-sorting protein
MRKRLLILCLALAVTPVFVSAASAQTADQIVEKYLAAVGGRDALEKLTSRRATGTATVTTPGGDLKGPLEIDTKAPNKTHVHITLDLSALGAGTAEVDQRFDGTAGLMSNSAAGDTPITGSQLDFMRNNTFPTPLLHYKDSGARLEIQPEETIGGRRAVVLLVTPKVGPPVKMYFDAENFLLLRTVVHVSNAALGTDVDQVSDLSDYRTADGVKVAFKILQDNGAQQLTLILTKVEHNVPLDDSIFVIR